MKCFKDGYMFSLVLVVITERPSPSLDSLERKEVCLGLEFKGKAPASPRHRVLQSSAGHVLLELRVESTG